MKIWIKYLIGIALGVAAALILPFDDLRWSATLSFITEIIVRIGRYSLLPLLFFSGIMAAYRLKSDGFLLRTTFWTVGTIIATSLLLTTLGLISILAVNLPRIPIAIERVSDVDSIGIQNLMRNVFPYSAFNSLTQDAFLLPAFVFALMIGFGCCIKHSNLKPLTSFFDAMSELFYNISSAMTELFSAGIVFVMCSWTIQFRDVIKSGVFTPLIIMLLVDFAILVGIVYPLILRFLCKNRRPFKILYASLVPFFISFFSGDTNLSLLSEMRMGKERLGIRQRTNGFSFPLFSIFARGGTSLIVIISFIMVWRSYSTLSIEFFDMLLISLTALVLSFILGNIPVGGTFTALTILCTLYGRGMETGYLLLKPAAVILGSFAALFDAASAMFGCYIIANKTKTIEARRPKNF